LFAEPIYNTPFTSAAANEYFRETVYGDEWAGDVTLISTLRALLTNRIGENALFCTQRTWGISISRQGNYTNEQLLDAVHSRFDGDYDNSFSICWFTSEDKAANEKIYGLCRDHYADRDGWVKLNAITDFFRKSFDVCCFVHEESKRTVYILKEMDTRKYHCLQVSALTAMPWYFDPTKGDKVTEKEISLMNSLRGKDKNEYLRCLQDIADEYDFETEFVRRSLSRIETEYERSRLDSVKREIEDSMHMINDYQRTINDTLRAINKKNIELIGLQAKIDNNTGESILSDYFLCNKKLRLDYVNGTRVDFHVNDYMTYFDSDMAGEFIGNRRSVIYRCGAPGARADAVEKLMRAIFVDETIKVRMCAAYSIDIQGGFTAMTGYDFRGDAGDRMPNPHINQYSCLGNYRQVINDRLVARDFIGVLEQAVASAKSLNVADGVVFERFLRDLYACANGRCLELEDGTQMTFTEALDYVEKEPVEKETEE